MGSILRSEPVTTKSGGSQLLYPSRPFSMRPRRPLIVRSQGEVCRIDPEPVWLVCPGFADELVVREALQGLEASGVVIGIQKELQMRPQPIVAVVVIAPHRRVLEGAVHPLGLAVRPGMVGFGEPVLDAVLAA